MIKIDGADAEWKGSARRDTHWQPEVENSSLSLSFLTALRGFLGDVILVIRPDLSTIVGVMQVGVSEEMKQSDL